MRKKAMEFGMPNESAASRRFTEGVIFAASWLIESHDQPTLALELLGTVGLDKAHLKVLKRQLEPTERANFQKAGFFKAQQ